MRHIALAGLALSISGAIGIVASELIGTAYANRPSERDYLLAINSGSSLALAAPSDTYRIAGQQDRAGMVCARVLRLPGVDLGYLCRRTVR